MANDKNTVNTPITRVRNTDNFEIRNGTGKKDNSNLTVLKPKSTK